MVQLTINQKSIIQIIEQAEIDITKLLTDYALDQYEWAKETGILFSNARKYAMSKIKVSILQKEGAGLGLYVVKCLADKLGYEVNASVDNSDFRIALIINR